MERCPDYEREMWLDMKAEYERKKKNEIQIFLDTEWKKQCEKHNIEWKDIANQ